MTDEALVQCFGGFIALANSLSAGDPGTDFVIEELEVNPFVCASGSLVALDGLCRIGRPQIVRPPRPQAKIDRMLPALKAIDSPWFGVNLDSGNVDDTDVYPQLQKIVPYAVNVQLKVETGPVKQK